MYKISRIKPISIEKTDPTAEEISSGKKQKIRNKWFLYYTLINNNSLILYRKKEYSFNRLVGTGTTTTNYK